MEFSIISFLGGYDREAATWFFAHDHGANSSRLGQVLCLSHSLLASKVGITPSIIIYPFNNVVK